MYVERNHVEKLRQSYERGQLLLEIAKFRGLNEFNLNEMLLRGKEGNSTSSDLSLDDERAINFTTKKAERFEYSIRVDDAEEAEQNHFDDKEMNGIPDEIINNISPSSYPLSKKITQENIPGKKMESDFVFPKPKVYECYYCDKLFFHTATYRTHMIHHLKKYRWCSVCSRGFISRIWFKKHRTICRKY